MMEPRIAIHVDETMHTPHGYVPAVVIENEPGYYPLTGNGDTAQPWYWGHDITVAKHLADEANTQLGLSPHEARQIVSSSIAASLTQDAGPEPGRERWDRIHRQFPPRPHV